MATLGGLHSTLGPVQSARAAPSIWLRARQMVWLARPAAVAPVAAPVVAQALHSPPTPVVITDTPAELLQRPTDDPPMTEELLRVLRASGGL